MIFIVIMHRLQHSLVIKTLICDPIFYQYLILRVTTACNIYVFLKVFFINNIFSTSYYSKFGIYRFSAFGNNNLIKI